MDTTGMGLLDGVEGLLIPAKASIAEVEVFFCDPLYRSPESV
jgi:hypothetical protein